MLTIPRLLFEHIISHCQTAYPEEACGLLLGTKEGEGCRIAETFPARNLNHERAHDRYELDPRDFLAADREARSKGLEIVGIYHSHPDHPPIASATDTERAWEGYRYLIVALRKKELNGYKAWRLKGSQMKEEFVEVDDGEGPHSDTTA